MSIRFPQAAWDVEDLFNKAEAQGVDATIIAAPELTTNGRGCVARWTGDEMIVLELSPKQLSGFGIQPGMLVREISSPGPGWELPHAYRVSLSDIKIDRADQIDAHSPLTGQCIYEYDDPADEFISASGLQIRYFRPDLNRQVPEYWYPIDSPFVPLKGTFQFSYPPLFSDTDTKSLKGTMVVFFQLLTGRDWHSVKGCRRVSNIAASVVELV